MKNAKNSACLADFEQRFCLVIVVCQCKNVFDSVRGTNIELNFGVVESHSPNIKGNDAKNHLQGLTTAA